MRRVNDTRVVFSESCRRVMSFTRTAQIPSAKRGRVNPCVSRLEMRTRSAIRLADNASGIGNSVILFHIASGSPRLAPIHQTQQTLDSKKLQLPSDIG
jgi:hypothetical protein